MQDQSNQQGIQSQQKQIQNQQMNTQETQNAGSMNQMQQQYHIYNRKRVQSSHQGNSSTYDEADIDYAIPSIADQQMIQQQYLQNQEQQQYLLNNQIENRELLAQQFAEQIVGQKNMNNTGYIQNSQSVTSLQQSHMKKQSQLKVQVHTPFISRPSSSSTDSKVATVNSASLVLQQQIIRDNIDQEQQQQQKHKKTRPENPLPPVMAGKYQNKSNYQRIIQEENESELGDTAQNISLHSAEKNKTQYSNFNQKADSQDSFHKSEKGRDNQSKHLNPEYKDNIKYDRYHSQQQKQINQQSKNSTKKTEKFTQQQAAYITTSTAMTQTVEGLNNQNRMDEYQQIQMERQLDLNEQELRNSNIRNTKSSQNTQEQKTTNQRQTQFQQQKHNSLQSLHQQQPFNHTILQSEIPLSMSMGGSVISLQQKIEKERLTQQNIVQNTENQQKQQTPMKTKSPAGFMQSPFFKELKSYSSINWGDLNNQFLSDKLLIRAQHAQMERKRILLDLYQNFITKEFGKVAENPEDLKLINSLLLQQVFTLIQDQENLIKNQQLVIPEQEFMNEYQVIQEIFQMVIKMDNPDELDIKRKELQDLYQKTLDYKFKQLDFSQSTITRQFIEFLQKVMFYFSTYQTYQKDLFNKMKSLEGELKEMQLVIKDYNQKANRNIEDLQNQSPFKIQSRQHILNQLDQSFNQLFLGDIKDLQNKLKDSEKERDKLNKVKHEKDKIIKQLKEQIEILQRKPILCDQSTQINLIIIPNKQSLKKSPFSSFLSDSMSPFTFTKNCTSSIISMAFSEKILDDYICFQRRKPYKPLVQYIGEWFLKTFSNKLIGSLFLKNFIQSVEEYQNSNKRFLLFSILTNMEDTQQKRCKKVTSTTEIKKQFQHSLTSLIVTMKIAFVSRQKMIDHSMPLFPLCLSVSANEEEGSVIQQQQGGAALQNMLMSMSGVHDHYMCATKKAILVVENILVDSYHLVDPSQGAELQKIFENYAKEDLKQRKKSENDLVAKEISAIKQVPLDVIITFVLDYMGDYYAGSVDNFLTQLKMASVERRNGFLQFEDFYQRYLKVFKNNRSKEFVEDCFCKFYFSNGEKASMGNEEQKMQVLKEFVDLLVSEENQHEFYLRPQLLQVYQSIHKQNKSPTKKNKTKEQLLNMDKEMQNLEIPVSFIKEITYDVYASCTILEEVYDNLKNLIRQEEPRDERIKLEHENFKLIFSKIQKENLSIEDVRLQAIELCEKSWNIMRKLLDYLSAKLKSGP